MQHTFLRRTNSSGAHAAGLTPSPRMQRAMVATLSEPEAPALVGVGPVAVLSVSRSNAEALGVVLSARVGVLTVPMQIGRRVPLVKLLALNPCLVVVDTLRMRTTLLKRIAAVSRTIGHGARDLSRDSVAEYGRLGFVSVVGMHATVESLCGVVRAVLNGTAPPPAPNCVMLSATEGGGGVLRIAPAAAERLTPRERQLAVLAARGVSNADLANLFGLSIATVKNHLHNAFAKLGAHGREELRDALFSRPSESGVPGIRT